MAPFATIYSSVAFRHPRIVKGLAAANINGLEVEIPPDFEYGVTNKTPKYLAKFPQGKIPTLETPDGFCLSESTAIAYFLADSGPKREQLLGRDTRERALIQQWVSFSDLEIFETTLPLLLMQLGRSPYDEAAVTRKEGNARRALTYLNGHLKGRKWLVKDDEVTLADLSVGGALSIAFKYYLDKEARAEFPEIPRWYTELTKMKEVADAFGVVETDFIETRLSFQPAGKLDF
ncbi:glutathione S-transferase [Lineolata rhizophorae]|uniref:Glutathione S-transferase n=1 Tax=Lineolata rhizophorae TaxID=578093 RepID=A0A6A6P8K1_9PEZI|nr:glutathione S-transferase [Lineolata rhizophorae]